MIPTPWWTICGVIEKDDEIEDLVPLYHAKDRAEGREMLSLVMRQEELPSHARFDDFRLVPPTDPRTQAETEEAQRGYLTMSGPPRRRRRIST